MPLPAAHLGTLAVHLVCGGVRGTVVTGTQTCPCTPGVEPAPRLADLCVVCAAGVAVSASPWSYLTCASCTSVELHLRQWLGRTILPVGRRAHMNAFAGPEGRREDLLPYLPALVDLLPIAGDLPAHGRRLVRALAADFPGHLEEVPLETWCSRFPESLDRSLGVYEGLLRMPLPGWARGQVHEDHALGAAVPAPPASAAWTSLCEEVVTSAGRRDRCGVTAHLQVRRGADGTRTALCSEHLAAYVGEEGNAVVQRARARS